MHVEAFNDIYRGLGFESLRFQNTQTCVLGTNKKRFDSTFIISMENHYSKLYNQVHSVHKNYGLSKIRTKALNNYLTMIEFSSVIDLGAGQGQLLDHIRKIKGKEIELFGVEVSDIAIEKGKKKFPNIKIIQEDITQYKSNKKYDLSCCTDVLEHLNINEISYVLSLMRELSSKYVLIETCYSKKTKEDDERWGDLHVSPLSMEELRKMVLSYFKIIKEEKKRRGSKIIFLCKTQ